MSPAAAIYDVCIVGAGPAGSTCGYYLARAGKRVVVLEREHFPRDKLCGDAVCSRAYTHLDRMGVLPALEREGRLHYSRVGGFVTPAGRKALGDSTKAIGRPLVAAIKRIVLDERIARASRDAGAELVEGARVTGAAFSAQAGTWTVRAAIDRGAAREWTARALVCADGANSRLARALGIVKGQPDGTCTRSYVAAGTHGFESDGVCFYPAFMIPGYCALFREAGGEVNFATYIVPGGKLGIPDVQAAHARCLREVPGVREALGGGARMEKVRAGPLRLGGVPVSVAEHLLVIGDAAGHTDPLTGEGIHHAMDGAELAAQTLIEALERGDLSARYLRRYHERWMSLFGKDFRWSALMARALARAPRFLEATAGAVGRKGPEFFQEWAKMMTGVRAKRAMLRPDFALPILVESVRQLFSKAPA
jgi:geranylgeranyl reductase family protein